MCGLCALAMLLFNDMRKGRLFNLHFSPLLLNGRSHASDVTDYSYPATPNHSVHPQPAAPSYAVGDAAPLGPANQAPEHEYRAAAASARHMALNRPQQPPPPPPPQAAEGAQASAPMAPADYG